MMTMKVFFGTPPGCNCHPTTYAGSYTWALYSEEEEFLCSGSRFDTWNAAYQAGREFCETLPSEDPPGNVDQN
jgi:hypothetical protein